MNMQEAVIKAKKEMEMKGKEIKEKTMSEKEGKAEMTSKAGGITLRIPPMQKIITTAENKAVMEKAVNEVKNYLANIPIHMTDLVDRVANIRAASPEEKTVRAEELRELEGEILAHLSGSDEVIVTAAKEAYALAMVKACQPSKPAVLKLIHGSKFSKLPGLISVRILEEGSKGMKAQVGSHSYTVRGKRDFANFIAKSLETLACQAEEETKEFYKKLQANLENNATISFLDVVGGKPGRFYIDVPEERVGEKIRKGGRLLCESTGKVIRILESCGHFHQIMTKIRDADVSLPVGAISSERFEIKRRLPDEEFRHTLILHSVLRRGLLAAQTEKKRRDKIEAFHTTCESEKVVMEAKASVSLSDWLLKSAVGTALLYLGRKPWIINKEGEEDLYFEVFFLVEQSADARIRIVEYPERLSELFGDKFSEWTAANELPYPLSAMLKMARAYHSSLKTTADEMEATRQWVEREKQKAAEVEAARMREKPKPKKPHLKL